MLDGQWTYSYSEKQGKPGKRNDIQERYSVVYIVHFERIFSSLYFTEKFMFNINKNDTRRVSMKIFLDSLK